MEIIMESETITKFYFNDFLEYFKYSDFLDDFYTDRIEVAEIITEFITAKNILKQNYIYKININKIDYFKADITEANGILKRLTNLTNGDDYE
jgi:hypothetical protein